MAHLQKWIKHQERWRFRSVSLEERDAWCLILDARFLMLEVFNPESSIQYPESSIQHVSSLEAARPLLQARRAAPRNS